MKKLICAILTLCMLLALISCAAFAQADDDVKAADMLGTVNGNHYENRTLGIRADIPDTWRVFTAEEAMELMGMGMELLEADPDWFADLLEQNVAVFDLYTAALDNSGDNINIQVQKNPLNALQRALITEDQVITSSIPEMEKLLAESGMMDDLKIEKGTGVFLGKERSCIDVSATMYGVPIYEKCFMLLKGDYMGVITSFSLDKNAVAENLDMFKSA